MEIPLIIWQRYYHLNSLIIALVNWVNSSFSLNQQDQPFIFKLFFVTSASSSSTPPTCILWIPSWISTRVCWMRLSHRSTLKALTECPPHRCVPRYHVAWHEVTWHGVTWRYATWHDTKFEIIIIQRLHISFTASSWNLGFSQKNIPNCVDVFLLFRDLFSEMYRHLVMRK